MWGIRDHSLLMCLNVLFTQKLAATSSNRAIRTWCPQVLTSHESCEQQRRLQFIHAPSKLANSKVQYLEHWCLCLPPWKCPMDVQSPTHAKIEALVAFFWFLRRLLFFLVILLLWANSLGVCNICKWMTYFCCGLWLVCCCFLWNHFENHTKQIRNKSKHKSCLIRLNLQLPFTLICVSMSSMSRSSCAESNSWSDLHRFISSHVWKHTRALTKKWKGTNLVELVLMLLHTTTVWAHQWIRVIDLEF